MKLTKEDRANPTKCAERFAEPFFDRAAPWVHGDEIHITREMLVDVLRETYSIGFDSGRGVMLDEVLSALTTSAEGDLEARAFPLAVDFLRKTLA